MPTTSITFQDKFLTTTLYQLMKDSVDQLHVACPWFDVAKKKFGDGKPQWSEGGEIMIEPWSVAEHSQITAVPTGYEMINLGVVDTDIAAQWTWGAWVMPIVISEIEEKKNSGSNAKASIIKRRQENVMNAFKRKFLQQTWKGDVAVMSALNTFNGVDNTSTGFLENAAVGSQTNTVGGISKTTYATLPGVQNQRYDAANSFNANGLAALSTINTAIKVRHPKGSLPDAWMWSETFYTNVKRAVSAYERFAGGGGPGVDAGKMYEVWGGVPCYTEQYLPDDGTNTTANPISAVAVSMDYMHTVWHPTGFFEMDSDGFISNKPNQLTKVCNILVMCQNKVSHLGCQGLIVRAETF